MRGPKSRRARMAAAALALFAVLVAGDAIFGILAFRQIATAPFRETELSRKLLTGLLAAEPTRMRELVPGDIFCIVGIGRDPHAFAKRRVPDYASVKDPNDDDPFFLRSHSHWHVVAFTVTAKTYQLVPVPVSKIRLPDEHKHAECARDFALTTEKGVVFGEEKSILRASTLSLQSAAPPVAALEQPAGAPDAPARTCAEQLSEYMQQLERLFRTERRSSGPYMELNREYFPLEGCGEEIFKIAVPSVFLEAAGMTFTGKYVFTFNNGIIGVGFTYFPDTKRIAFDHVDTKLPPK